MSFLFASDWEEPVMKRILLPLQGFPAEINAINLAFYLAEYSRATVSVLHCKETLVKTQEFWLDRLTGHVKSISMLLNVPYETTLVKRYRASDAILNAAHKEECDLILMSAACKPIYKQLLGSTSRRVVSKSKIPTIVVASWLEDFARHQEPVIKKILLPIDDTTKDIAALRFAAALKKSSAAKSAELIALHVTLLPMVVSLTAADSEECLHDQEVFLKDVSDFTTKTGLKVTPKHVAARKIGDATVEMAAKEDVDLIVLGAQRKPRRFQRILGRVSFKIASRSKAAVVLTFAP
ncbi:MAG: universal stress protein [Promethearchaeota archaeon]